MRRLVRPSSMFGAAAAALLAGACAVLPPPLPPGMDGAVAGAPSPEIPAPAPPDLSSPTRLATLLPVLFERSPSIATARARLEAAAEKRPQVVALPDPMLETRWYVRNPMEPDGENYRRWELMITQEIPLPWMLSLRGEAADQGTRAAAYRYEAAVRDAVAALEDVHAERRYLAAAAAVQAKLLDVYRRWAVVAAAGMTDGAARLPDAFRAEALAAQAEYDLRLLAEMRGVEDAKLRALLALAPSAPVGPPADAAAVRDLATPNERLVERALEWNQELRAAGAMVAMAETDARMARWNYAPMLLVGGSKMFNDDFDMEDGTTRDATTLTFGVTLPIWRPKLAAGVREADANLRAARTDEQGMRAMVAADVTMAAFQVRTTARLADLYRRTLVPQAERALSVAEARVRDGDESLASALELAATWQQMTLARLRAEADHARAVAALERLLGTTLTDAGGDDAPRAEAAR